MNSDEPPRAAPPALTGDQVSALYARGKQDGADAAADATAAATRNEFGMILTGNRSTRAIGLACFTPTGRPPRVLAELQHGDVIDATVMRWIGYARTYNRTLVKHPAYPDPDLCRAVTEAEERSGFEPKPDSDARPVTGPVRTLHQAARRGSQRDLERLLRSASVNAPDSLGMTPLAWAVARGNRIAIDVLLSASANPWVGNPAQRTGAVYWAAALGRRLEFERLIRLPGRPFTQWPALFQAAAVSSGEVAIIQHMLAEPHDRFRLEFVYSRPLPAPEMFAPVLREDRAVADQILARAVDYDQRADLVRVALEHGADPNGVRSYETALGLASKGIGEESVAIIDLLLRAGADPNLVSHRSRPIWNAAKSMRIDQKGGEWSARARAVFLRLLGAGARLDLPDDQGRPQSPLCSFLHAGITGNLTAGSLPNCSSCSLRMAWTSMPLGRAGAYSPRSRTRQAAPPRSPLHSAASAPAIERGLHYGVWRRARSKQRALSRLTNDRFGGRQSGHKNVFSGGGVFQLFCFGGLVC